MQQITPDLARGARFPETERRFLLGQTGIGPSVIARLEQVGFGSMQAVEVAGVGCVIDAVIASVRSTAWRNRSAALADALHAWQVHTRSAPERLR